jgi:hypothetical protein
VIPRSLRGDDCLADALAEKPLGNGRPLGETNLQVARKPANRSGTLTPINEQKQVLIVLIQYFDWMFRKLLI